MFPLIRKPCFPLVMFRSYKKQQHNKKCYLIYETSHCARSFPFAIATGKPRASGGYAPIGAGALRAFGGVGGVPLTQPKGGYFRRGSGLNSPLLCAGFVHTIVALGHILP